MVKSDFLKYEKQDLCRENGLGFSHHLDEFLYLIVVGGRYVVFYYSFLSLF